jgi:hypothetical protein
MAIADIIIAPATVYKAPSGETFPAVDTIGYGTAWGGNWTNVGYTLTPVTLAYTQELFELEVEQITFPVKTLRVKETAQIETTLAELTGANLNLVLDGTLTTVAATSTLRGNEKVESGGKTAVTQFAWGFEGFFKQDGLVLLPIRVFLYLGTPIMNGNLQFAKRAAAGIPLQVKAQADISKTIGKNTLVIQKVTAKNTVES